MYTALKFLIVNTKLIDIKEELHFDGFIHLHFQSIFNLPFIAPLQTTVEKILGAGSQR